MNTAPLPAPVHAAIDAVNKHDTTTFIALFTADGFVNDWGREFKGHDAIKRWSDNELIGKKATLKVTSVTEANGVTTVKADVGGNGFNGPSDFIFTLSGEKIASMRIPAQ